MYHSTVMLWVHQSALLECMLSSIVMHVSHVLSQLHSTSMIQKRVQEDIHDLLRQLTAQRTELQLQQKHCNA